jgi:hypothetical protein
MEGKRPARRQCAGRNSAGNTRGGAFNERAAADSLRLRGGLVGNSRISLEQHAPLEKG